MTDNHILTPWYDFDTEIGSDTENCSPFHVQMSPFILSQYKQIEMFPLVLF